MKMNLQTSIAATGIAAGTRRPGRQGALRFASGLLLGLGAGSLFTAGVLPRPKARLSGVASDWQAVGDDLTAAMHSYGNE